jgi:DNA-binding transcriptional LysR family regulator
MKGKISRSAELGELRAFCTAADMGSLGRAALRLGVSQPALWKRIRSLEALAGVELLERSPKGVTLSGAGRRLYAEARRLLEQSEQVDALMAGLVPEAPPVRLAVSHTIAEFLLPPVLVTFEAQGGQSHSLELTVGNSAMARRLVAAGLADLGIVATDPTDPGDELDETPLFDDPLVVGVPRAHRWARRQRIRLVDFLRTPMVMRDPEANSRRVLAAELAARGLELAPPLAEVGNTLACRRVALERSAPTYLSKTALATDEALVAKPIEGLELSRAFVAVSRGPESLPPPARRLAAVLAEQLGSSHP